MVSSTVSLKLGLNVVDVVSGYVVLKVSGREVGADVMTSGRGVVGVDSVVVNVRLCSVAVVVSNSSSGSTLIGKPSPLPSSSTVSF